MAWPMEPADAERRVWGDAEGVAVHSRWSWWWTAGIPAGRCGAFQAPRDARERMRRQDAAAPAGWKPAVREIHSFVVAIVTQSKKEVVVCTDGVCSNGSR